MSRLIMSELTPLVSAHHGAFFIMDNEAGAPMLQAHRELRVPGAQARRQPVRASAKGSSGRRRSRSSRFCCTNVPDDYIQITSGLGEAPPRNIIVLPDPVRGRSEGGDRARELPAVQPDPPDLPRPARRVDRRRAEHDQREHAHRGAARAVAEADAGAAEPVEGAAAAAGRAQALELASSRRRRRRCASPRSCSRSSRKSCSRSTRSSRRRPALLAEQNQKVEQKNREVEAARVALEEKAEQLALSSQVQERVPGEHDRTSCARRSTRCSSSRKLLTDNKDGNLIDEAGGVRADDLLVGHATCSTSSTTSSTCRRSRRARWR